MLGFVKAWMEMWMEMPAIEEDGDGSSRRTRGSDSPLLSNIYTCGGSCLAGRCEALSGASVRRS